MTHPDDPQPERASLDQVLATLADHALGRTGPVRWVVVRDEFLLRRLASLESPSGETGVLAGALVLVAVAAADLMHARPGHRVADVATAVDGVIPHEADLDPGAVLAAVAAPQGAGLVGVVVIPGEPGSLAAGARSHDAGGQDSQDSHADQSAAQLPGPLSSAGGVAYLDKYGTTIERGPHEGLIFVDHVGGSADLWIDASPATLWEIVTDIDLPTRFSTESLGATWVTEDRGVGAEFTGRNENAALGTWEVPCFVIAREEERSFGWATVSAADPGAQWWYDLKPETRETFETRETAEAPETPQTPATRDGTRLTHRFVIGPGRSGLNFALDANPDLESRIMRRRVDEHITNIRSTLAGLKALAEGLNPAEAGN